MKKHRIGIFGGSFNPIHYGHLHICDAFLKSKLVDDIWVLPVYDPPHKFGVETVSFEHRLEMTRLAFQGKAHIIVSDVEKHLDKPNYTLNTIRFLQHSYPEHTFLLCIGGDSLINFHTWFCYQQLLQIVDLIVVRREESDYQNIDAQILSKTTFIESNVTPESSSEIRKEIAETGSSSQVPKVVLSYIIDNKLYSPTPS